MRTRRGVTTVFAFVCIISIGRTGSGAVATVDDAYKSSFEKAIALHHAGEYRDAIRAYESALRLARESKKSRDQLDCILGLGILNWDIGELKTSAACYSDALILSRKLAESILIGECLKILRIHDLYTRGKADRLARRFENSVREYREAIALGEAIGKPEFVLKCLRQLSLSYHDQEKMEEFLELNERGLRIARQLKHRREEARCLNHVGLYYFWSNRFSKALAKYDEALEVLNGTAKNEVDQSDCMNNIALTYLSLGDYDKALRYLNRALEIDVRIRDQENVAVDLKNIGIILRNRGEFNHNECDINSSIEYHFRCLDLAGQLNKDGGKADLLNNLGLSYSSLHDYSTALVNFRSALEVAAAFDRTGDAGTILCNIGHTYLQMGKASEARSAFLKSIDLALKTGREVVLWESYFGLGKCLESDGELTSAMGCYKKAADIIDRIRCRLSWDEQKTGFARDKWKVYEAWVDILYQRQQAGFPDSSDFEIWRTIERAKARAFVEELRQMESFRPTPLDPLHLRAQKQLTREISGTLSELTDRGLEAGTRKELLGRLEREEDAYTSLRNRLRTEAAGDSPALLADATPLDRIQQDLLDPETAVLEFFLGEKRSFVVLITRNKLVINLLPSRSAIEDSLKAYLKVLSSPPQGRFPGFRAARRLYREFMAPLENQLGPSIRNLVIVPEGILCYLPFETLVRDDGDEFSGKYLIETYRVSYAPSVSSLALLGRPQHEDTASRRILALGNPVYARHSQNAGPGKKTDGEALREIYLDSGFDFSELKYSKKEVRDIARIFPPKSVDIYTGADATEDVVKKSPLTNYRIIHFACHGFLDERTPLRSALVLSLDEDLEEDGFLQAREIYDLRLSADLVVLSACQTGQGRLENGEGVLGLPRVFFCAGARSIISSLWKISDRSTASLMINFYRSLAGGADKAQSLRAAKLMMLKSRFSHPFYWAGFVLNGDYRIRPNGLSANR